LVWLGSLGSWDQEVELSVSQQQQQLGYDTELKPQAAAVSHAAVAAAYEEDSSLASRVLPPDSLGTVQSIKGVSVSMKPRSVDIGSAADSIPVTGQQRA